ncbi:glyoxalase superfamily protein [Pontibacillus yanchengensis]|uniref:glyoxalase superfamily protein n=1 Tax=Pontibacillus yanchengensis TaxID=462910 RepID=UPI0005690E3D|nr:glyoxalase superfamily protein [Pontibacillus yanchengensis]
MQSTNSNIKQSIPIFRIFDVEKAKEFYITYLGFSLDWEHRFEEHFPLYMQVSSGGITLHLSEHHGDCSPGAAVRVEVEGLKALHNALESKAYAYANPAIESKPWGTKEMQLTDPFGNKLIFYQWV